MEKHIFKIDDKNPLYKKLIKLPTAYYIVKENGNVNTVSSHIGTVEVANINDLKLKKQGDKIFLYEGNLPLQAEKFDESGNSIKKDLIVEQEAIVSTNRNNIIEKLESKPILTSLYNIKDSPYFGIKLSSRGTTGVLNFINFNDENDPVLQKIKEETGGLYFTIEGDNIFISDKDGECLPICEDGSCYKYQYTKNEHNILEISEISTIIENLTKAEQCGVSEATTKAGQDCTLQQGEKLSDNIYQADIMLNGKLVATLPKIGYYMLDDQLVIRNHVTEEEVKIPRDFHYLKVVKSGNNDDYKLTFCNFLGNEFFEHKKYDPQYSNVPDEYQYISLNCMKKEYKPNFCKLLNDKPSFFITEGTTDPGYCPADVFELTKSGKGRKIATLIDQFGSFNENGEFQYCDYHTKAEYDVYNSYKIHKEYTAADANNEFHFDDGVILYAIPELS
ncbi:hypothetical protein Wcon_01755 [Wolbachia endosymbiont of Cylisticus convexus]|uniref:hypothetical protein n=1 Tax=Wolbachia endosymbiont of Cylisticus convexus TaxID=118728 RepID=UPI000DF6CEC7|nr:hypothetical protein [Wolbachia endosymbiont of Cylisticus convexus]RDD34184.1 hypothetical protein Wcon_01755 [Wolbachia endosymbiont of Cylisticus convexus]